MFSPRQFVRIGGAILLALSISNCRLPIFDCGLLFDGHSPGMKNWQLEIDNDYIAKPPST
jgi:hypothetical protein